MSFPQRFALIRTQLILGFGLILVLAFVIALIGFFALERLRQGSEQTIDESVRIRELSLEIENEFLQARQSESEFLTSWRGEGFRAAREEHVTNNSTHLGAARDDITEIRNLIESSEDAELQEVLTRLDELSPLLDDYETDFLATVDTVEQRSQANGVEQELLTTWADLLDTTRRLPEKDFYQTLLQIRVEEQSYLNSGRLQHADSLRLLKNEFKQDILDANNDDIALPNGTTIDREAINLQVDHYYDLFTQLTGLDQNIRTYTTRFRDATEDINTITRELGAAGNDSLRRAETEQKALSDQSRLALVVAALVALAIGSLTAFYLSWRINRPLRELTTVATAIGRGDLTQEVKIQGQDEFATLGLVFNQMTSELRELIGTLEERVGARTRDLQTAAEVSKQITTVLDLDKLLQAVVSTTTKSFGFYGSFVFLYNTANEELAMAAGADRDGNLLQIESTIPLSANPSIIALAARKREAIIYNDTLNSKEFLKNEALPLTRAEIAIPMVVAETLMGVFDVQSDKVNRFTEDDIRILTALAEQITIATRNAQLYKQSQEAFAEAEQANKVKSQFLASMSHELRTPLNAILNFTQFVASGMLGDVNEEQVDALQKTVASGEHLLNLINDVLDISKIEAGALELFVEDDLNVKDELQMVVANADGLLAGKPVTIVETIDEDLPLIRGDKLRIRQIMLNLLSNACKFTDEGNITITAKLQGQEVLMAVKDSGPGISPDDHGTIFETFRQTKTGLRKGKGTGLGLPISRRLAEAHGGRLWLESEVGKGSTFYVALPVKSEVLTPTLNP